VTKPISLNLRMDVGSLRKGLDEGLINGGALKPIEWLCTKSPYKLVSLCNLCVLCVSVVDEFEQKHTTETQRTQRLHREEGLHDFLCKALTLTDYTVSHIFTTISRELRQFVVSKIRYTTARFLLECQNT